MTAGGSALLTRQDAMTEDPEHALRILRDECPGIDPRWCGGTEGFRFSHRSARAPSFGLARLIHSAVGEAGLTPAPDVLHVDVCRSGRMEFSRGRESMRPAYGTPLLLAPGAADWRLRWDDPVVDVVVVARDVVLAQAEAVAGRALEKVEFTSATPRSPVMQKYWARVVAHVRDGVLANDDAVRSPLVLAETARMLATALVTVFPNTTHAHRDDPGPARAEPATVRRAVAYIEEHAGEPIGIADIALAAGVGTRGLQHAFRRYRGVTPLQMLRQVRLDRAHRELQDADPIAGDTVAAIAARWGFPHPGRFSVEYRRTHGRPPSRTLRA